MNVKLPNYGNVEVESEPFCKGCNDKDLGLHTERMLADGMVIESCTVIACENIERCRGLYQRLKESQK